MTTNLTAWFATRPSSLPTVSAPARAQNVVAAALSRDRTADVRVIRRPDGRFTYLIEAWTNFADAGGGAHCQWHTFESPTGMIAASYEIAAGEAIRDAWARGIEIDEEALRANNSLERTIVNGR